MSDRPKMDDFKGADGKINWAAFRKAEVEHGDYCYECGHYTLSGSGFRQLCRDCRALITDREEVTHESIIRCPHCGHQQEMHSDYEEACYVDGDHMVGCNSCEKEYMIETRVSYEYKSPAMIDTSEEEEPCPSSEFGG